MGNGGMDGLDDGAVDIDEVTGDHGRDEAFELELRDRLLWDGVKGTKGGRSEEITDLAVGRLDGAGFTVATPSVSTLVDAFQGCLADFCLMVTLASSASGRFEAGEDSGVRLWLYLWPL